MFWFDQWVGTATLATDFPNLSVIARDPEALVSDTWINGQWKPAFKWSLGPDERDE